MRIGSFLATLLLLFPVVPVFVHALMDRAAWDVFRESGRFVSLLKNSVLLAGLSAGIAVPLGSMLSFVLERGRVPGQSVMTELLTVWLFVPLPVLAVAWQIVLGNWLPSLALQPGEVAWRPWEQGLIPAAIVHGIAGVPWVVVFVRAGLAQTDRGLEDDARMTGGTLCVLRRVLWPQLMPAMIVAAAWIGVQTMTEIPVTDAMMVRTFAEETYTQIVGAATGLNAAVLVTLMVNLVTALLGLALTRWLHQRFPKRDETPRASTRLDVPRLSCLIFAGVSVLLVVVLPFSALVWKCGTFEPFARTIRLDGLVIVQSLATALVTGVLAALLAIRLAWTADTVANRMLLFTAMWILLLTPGPILGLGLKDVILQLSEWSVPRALLYDQPSPLPTVISGLLRYLPLSVGLAMLWIRSLPRELLEQARMDGTSAWELVGRPGVAVPMRMAVLVVAGLSLGEVSAGKLVAPPGWRMFILDLFDQMHYGAEPRVAALCLVQIAMTVLLIGGLKRLVWSA